MAVYVVTWDLNRERPNYAAARAAFVSQVERFEHTFDPNLDSVRFISTSYDPSQVWEVLRQRLDANDTLVISRMNAGEHQGWLTKDVWSWIEARI